LSWPSIAHRGSPTIIDAPQQVSKPRKALPPMPVPFPQASTLKPRPSTFSEYRPRPRSHKA
jgi:hypothetical protein